MAFSLQQAFALWERYEGGGDQLWGRGSRVGGNYRHNLGRDIPP